MERHNPLLDPRPDDPIQQIHDYARDLAYLALINEHRSGSRLPASGMLHNDGPIHGNDKEYPNRKLLLKKWGIGEIAYEAPLRPNYATLRSFGYMEYVVRDSDTEYFLIAKAFQLLEKPAQSPPIFISYRHMESSAFALLIEARLQLKGGGGIFIDKNIEGGALWKQHIRDEIEKSSIFIVLLGKTAFEQDSWVVQELEWAHQSNCRIIPIWHNGHSLSAQKEIGEVPAVLDERQSHTIKEELALEYDTAIIWLLNTLGYRT